METSGQLSKLRIFWLACAAMCLLFMLGDAGHAAGKKELLGSWYAEIREEGTFDGKKYTVRRQIELNHDNGTKIVTFRNYDENRLVSVAVITFAWGADHDVYWAVCQTTVLNGRVTPCSYRTEYDIIFVNERELRYKSRQSGITYNHVRVRDDFRLP